MSKKAKILAAVSCLVLLAGVAAYLFFEHSRPLRLAFEKGVAHRYRLAFTVANSTVLFSPGRDDAAGGTATATVDIAAVLTLRGYGEREGRWVVGLSLADLERSAISFNERELLPPAEAAKLLTAAEAIIEWGGDGTIGDIRFPKEMHPLARNIIKAVLAEWQTPLSLPVGETTIEKTPYGAARARFDRFAEGEGEKRRDRYESLASLGERLKGGDLTQQIESRYRLKIQKHGSYESFSGGENLTVKSGAGLVAFMLRTKLDLRHIGIDRFNPEAAAVARFLSSYQREAMDESAVSENAEKGLLLQQARGMTQEELFRTLKILVRSGKIHNSDLFLWRASGLLKLHPELCAALVPLFADTASSHEARLLIVGLLATTATREAQEAFLAILNDDVVKGDPYYGLYYQHLTLLPAPVPAVRKLAEERYAAAQEDPSILRESGLTLGAVANNLRTSGDSAGAAEINRQLTADLAKTSGSAETSALLDSLGNVGDAGNVGTIIGYAGSNNDPNVRASAVNALRKNQTPESERALLGLAADEEPLVQKQALNTLTRYDLSEAQVRAFAEQVTDGRIEPTFYNDLVNMLGRYVPEYPEATRTVFESILKKGTDDPMLEARLRGLIDQTLKR